MTSRIGIGIACLAMLVGTSARGGVVVDNGFSNPVMTNGSTWVDDGRNFKVWDDFTLSSSVSVTGGSFYLRESSTPETYLFEIRNDNAGELGTSVSSTTLAGSDVSRTLVESYASQPGFPLYRYDFTLSTSLTLSAGVYWASLNGNSLAAGWNSSGGDGIIQEQLSDDKQFVRDDDSGIIPFQLVDNSGGPEAAVPEPTSLAIFGLGALGLLGIGRRTQKQRA